VYTNAKDAARKLSVHGKKRMGKEKVSPSNVRGKNSSTTSASKRDLSQHTLESLEKRKSLRPGA